VDADEHRTLGATTYNRCWELLESAERSPADDRELLTCAFTSRYHWGVVGRHEQIVSGDWMISRAAAAVGEGALSVNYGLVANEGARDNSTPDWLKASTAEGLARAYAAVGMDSERDHWIDVAARLVERISDAEDREIIATQLTSVPR